MTSDALTIRGVDRALLEQVRHILIRRHGTYYHFQAEVVNQALRLWLDQSEQRQTTSATMFKSELRPDVVQRIDLMRLAVEEWFEERARHGSVAAESLRNMDLRALRDIIRGVVGDERTVKVYMRRLLKLGFIELLTPNQCRVTEKWVPQSEPSMPPDEASRS